MNIQTVHTAMLKHAGDSVFPSNSYGFTPGTRGSSSAPDKPQENPSSISDLITWRDTPTLKLFQVIGNLLGPRKTAPAPVVRPTPVTEQTPSGPGLAESLRNAKQEFTRTKDQLAVAGQQLSAAGKQIASIPGEVTKAAEPFKPLAQEVARLTDTEAHGREVIRQIAEDRQKAFAENSKTIGDALESFEDWRVRSAVDAGKMDKIVGDSARMRALLYAREKDERRNAAMANLWKHYYGADSLPPYKVQDKERASNSHHGGDATLDRTSSPAVKQKQIIEGKPQSKSV